MMAPSTPDKKSILCCEGYNHKKKAQYTCLLKSVFSEIRVRKLVQVVSRKKGL